MDPRTGFVYNLTDEADPPAFGAKIPAEAALAAGMVEDPEALPPELQARLKEMVEKDEDLVAIGAEAAQRARLGDRELRRRRQRRR